MWLGWGESAQLRLRPLQGNPALGAVYPTPRYSWICPQYLLRRCLWPEGLVVGEGALKVFVGGGDGDGWRPLLDANSIGKSKRIQLVLVKNTNTQICFGCIGMDERRFCRSNQWSVRAHKKQRFDMGCNAGTLSQQGMQVVSLQCSGSHFWMPLNSPMR